ncbi:MAG: toll/interleukin-1 receptor domain-containing protein [Nitrosomonas sp.]|nr:toll/interleukin-1 receptor domain-containing protein [Nitrosomonas sp.]
MTEQFWEQLLDFVDDGRVIPVIGPELLVLEINGERTHLYTYLAKQLAPELGIDFQSEDTLNTVACRYLAQGGQRQVIYRKLNRVMPQPTEIKLPEALIKLAKIRPLKLFITTCFDPLLARALNQCRYGGLEKTQVLAFSPGTTNDLPEAFERLERATVFHFFGKLTVVPEYAVTDEDVLEFMHALQSRTSRPERLFDALVTNNLIVIGCSLSDWLARFFVRIGKKDRLVVPADKADCLAGDQLQHDKNFIDFLQHFSKETIVFPASSIEFVDELHRRWAALHPSTSHSEKLPDPPGDEVDKMQSGAVFLSYASEDRAAVLLIRDALEQAGIDVWFDRNPDALRAGDHFDNKIKVNINKCSLFIPVLSQHTLTQEPRYFRKEWHYAQEVAVLYPENKRFIIPLVIDETPDDQIPERFQLLHWERISGGTIRETFVDEIKQLYRQYQRTRTQSL